MILFSECSIDLNVPELCVSLWKLRIQSGYLWHLPCKEKNQRVISTQGIPVYIASYKLEIWLANPKSIQTDLDLEKAYWISNSLTVKLCKRQKPNKRTKKTNLREVRNKVVGYIYSNKDYRQFANNLPSTRQRFLEDLWIFCGSVVFFDFGKQILKVIRNKKIEIFFSSLFDRVLWDKLNEPCPAFVRCR